MKTVNYNMFLDDEREPVSADFQDRPWQIARNYDEFVFFIENRGLPKFISFDHDLGTDEFQPDEETDVVYSRPSKTGYDAAKWLVEYCMNSRQKIPAFYVHSRNPVGKKNIEAYLENAMRHMEMTS